MAKNRILSEEIIGNLGEKLHESPPINPPSETTLGAPPQSVIGETYNRSLDDAANTILNLLQPSLKDYAFELADVVLKIPRWQLLLGSMVAQYESGNLTAPSIDPSWRQVELLQKDSVCANPLCGKIFSPKRFGQKFCSNECGNAVRKIEIEERKKREANQERRFV